MTTNKTVDDESTDKPAVKPAADSKSSGEDVSNDIAKKESAAVSPAQSVATEETEAKTATAATAATAKAAASNESDIKAAAKKISDLDKLTADNSIKSKEGVEDLKARAHAAKLRAQQKILEKSYVSDPPQDPLERLANTFDSSARRWEMVVYPSLFAFVLLAGYGFFLIYRLTHDIAVLSQSVTHMAVIVSDAMPRMTKDLNMMTGSIDNMTGNIDGMSTEISSMSNQMNTLTPMSNNIQSMTHNIGSMNRSVYGMQRDIGGMNRTVSSGPLGMMNDVMPFSSSSNVPRPLAPSPVWPAYNTQPYNYSAPRAQPAANSQTKAQARTQLKKKPVKPLSQENNSKQQATPLKNSATKNVWQLNNPPAANPLSIKK